MLSVGKLGLRVSARHSPDAVPHSFRQLRKLVQQAGLAFFPRDLTSKFQFGHGKYKAPHDRFFGFTSHTRGHLGGLMLSVDKIFGSVLNSEQT